MSLDRPVSRLMRTDIVTVGLDARLSEIRALMVAGSLHHVPVVDADDELLGLVSFTDILSSGLGRDVPSGSEAEATVDAAHPVHEVMERALVTIDARETLAEASRLLATGDYHSLPVVDGFNHLVGILTTTDLIEYLHDLITGDS